MNRKHVLKSLADNLKWIETHDRDKGKPEDDWRALNVLVGCAEILGQCHQTMAVWLDEKPYRRPVLGRIQQSWATRDGRRTLRDLIRWAVVAVEAAIWAESFSIGALPMDREPKPLSAAKRRALKAATKRAREVSQEGRRPRVSDSMGKYPQNPKTAKSPL